MKIFSWSDIINTNADTDTASFFTQGCGISVGSFDGLHKGHRVLVNTLVEQCRKNSLVPGIVTFSRPLPSIKHSSDYQGDVSTLDQRLKLFEELGVAFAIVVDFDQNFAARSGTQFFELLIEKCNMKLIAEGVDFRCGYKGATDTQALKYFCQQNDIQAFFVSPVYYREGTDEEERISSSYIRIMIQKGFFSTVEELLERKYSYDTESALQIIPPDGVYHCCNEKNEDVRVEIKNRKISVDLYSKVLYF